MVPFVEVSSFLECYGNAAKIGGGGSYATAVVSSSEKYDSHLCTAVWQG